MTDTDNPVDEYDEWDGEDRSIESPSWPSEDDVTEDPDEGSYHEVDEDKETEENEYFDTP